MLASVSGWREPSLAFRKARVSSRSFRASAWRPRAALAGRDLGHGPERIGMVKAQLGLLQGQGFLEELERRRDDPSAR